MGENSFSPLSQFILGIWHEGVLVSVSSSAAAQNCQDQPEGVVKPSTSGWRGYGRLRLLTWQEVSGAKAEQVPVDQLPGERQRGQCHQAVVDAPPDAPEAPPPRQDGKDHHAHGESRRNERQDEDGGEQGRHTVVVVRWTAGELLEQEEQTPTRERRRSLLLGRVWRRSFTVCLPARLRVGAPRKRAPRTKPSDHSKSAERNSSTHAMVSTSRKMGVSYQATLVKAMTG